MDLGKVLDAIEELIDKIEDLGELEDLLDRYQEIRDKYERGEQPEPAELADLLADTMTYLTGKVPLGPYAWLVKLVIEFVKRAIEAGYYAGLGIAWQRYKTLREQGWTHEAACEQATLDETVCRWLKLKWLERQTAIEGGEEGSGPEEETDEEVGDGASPLIHTPPGPTWSPLYNRCCSQGTNGTDKPTVQVVTPPDWTPFDPPVMPDAFTLRMEIQITHACGIARSRVRVFNSLPPSTPGGPNSWTLLKPRDGMVEFQQGRDGKRKIKAVIVRRVKILITARSNCNTYHHEVLEYSTP